MNDQEYTERASLREAALKELIKRKGLLKAVDGLFVSIHEDVITLAESLTDAGGDIPSGEFIEKLKEIYT